MALTIDVQVHAYERDHPGRPWAGFLQGPEQVTGDDMIAAMDNVVHKLDVVIPAQPENTFWQMAISNVNLILGIIQINN